MFENVIEEFKIAHKNEVGFVCFSKKNNYWIEIPSESMKLIKISEYPPNKISICKEK